MKNIILCVVLVSLRISVLAQKQMPPEPFGAVPTDRQMAWHEMERYCFLHFTVNTFTDKEWGYGDEKEDVFNPSDFDADQIVSVIAKNGFKGAILTCKHHDGFCLWPSKYTEHSVKNSPWKNGKGDVVKEISEACKRHGIKFGIYLSPWDRNTSLYGTPEYITYYRNQLRELLTEYGEIFEVWLDGANGGNGYYGGANEERKIDKLTYYDWDNTWKLIRKLQPNACIFSDAGPDVRWCGNEDGYVGDTNWNTINTDTIYPGKDRIWNLLNSGEMNGSKWIPAEVDVSIRPGWFYHATEDNKVRDLNSLKEIYFRSIGNGGGLNLNLPPDRTGQINASDVKALDEFSDYLKKSFSKNLMQGAKVTASETRGKMKQFSPYNVLDEDKGSYWAVDDQTQTASLTFELKKQEQFNCMEIKEFIRLGQRIQSFSIEIEKDGVWQQIFKGSTIGYKKLARFGNREARKIRIIFDNTLACPVIESVRLYKVL